MRLVLWAYDATGAGSKWDTVSRFIADRLLASVVKNPSYYLPLIEMLHPVRDRLLDPLSTIFRDKQLSDKHALATSILADYASDDPAFLADLLLDSEEKHFAVLFDRLKAHQDVPCRSWNPS